jgi:hypothetical protein
MIGFVLTAAYSMSTLRQVCPPASASESCSPQGPINKALLTTVAGAGAGALIGWLLPVRRP